MSKKLTVKDLEEKVNRIESSLEDFQTRTLNSYSSDKDQKEKILSIVETLNSEHKNIYRSLKQIRKDVLRLRRQHIKMEYSENATKKRLNKGFGHVYNGLRTLRAKHNYDIRIILYIQAIILLYIIYVSL